MSIINNFQVYKDNFVVVHQGSGQPEISVVMPIYNCEEFVASAVTSILSQQEVIAEIIISDDASTDDTFAIAYKTVVDYIGQFGLIHTVLMRVGTSRLIRDHLHLLANKASCDLVCQAHGDDISHPHRCTVLVKAFKQDNKKVSMIFVNPSIIDYQGISLAESTNFSLSDIKVETVKYNDIITAQDDRLIGGNMAWRKSEFKFFPQLTTSYCTYGHDRVMAFRAFLVGGCYIVDSPLLQRRLHSKQLHKELLSFEHRPVNWFNYQLIRLVIYSTMKNDLIFLKENNIIDEDRSDRLANELDRLILQVTKFLTKIASDLIIDGYINKWVKENCA